MVAVVSIAENVDRLRGDFVFRRSIEALQTLNGLGYGRPETGLSLIDSVRCRYAVMVPLSDVDLPDDLDLCRRIGIEVPAFAD